jgi:hydrogenase maturation protease
VADQTKNILVLGVGNILLRDEGIGVRVVERVEREFRFSGNVRLMDGGVRGMILMDPITQADHVVVIDAVVNDQPPGTSTAWKATTCACPWPSRTPCTTWTFWRPCAAVN